MLRFVALHQWFKLGWIAQQFVNCSVGLGDRLIRSESMFVLEVQRYRATSGFSVIAMNEDLIDTATNQSIQEGGQLFSPGMSQCKRRNSSGTLPSSCGWCSQNSRRHRSYRGTTAPPLSESGRGTCLGQLWRSWPHREPAPVFRPPLD